MPNAVRSIAADGFKAQSKIEANAKGMSGLKDEAAVLCTREDGGSIWQSGLKLKGAAGDTPKDVSPHVLQAIYSLIHKT